MIEKRCTRCGKVSTEPEVEFYRDRRTMDGLSFWCKDCLNEKTRARRLERRDEQRFGCNGSKHRGRDNFEVVFDPTGFYYGLIRGFRESLRGAVFAEGTIVEREGQRYQVMGRQMPEDWEGRSWPGQRLEKCRMGNGEW